MTQALYRFEYDCGRSGELCGLFVAEKDEIEALIGKRIYFGEVLGKHSEVVITFDEECVDILTEDQDFISKFIQFGLTTGFNPIDYAPEDEED